MFFSGVEYLLAPYKNDAINILRRQRPKQIGKMASLATVRDALLISRCANIIDGVEFACLYDANSSRLTFPYYKFERFDIDASDESECWTELRFEKQDLDLLQIPDEIVCCQRSVCEGMCILLKRLAYPCRYTDMVPRFGRNPTEICLIFNEMLDLIYTNHCHRFRNCRNPFLQPGQLHRYADAIHLQGSPLENCFGFVDRTVRSIDPFQ